MSNAPDERTAQRNQRIRIRRRKRRRKILAFIFFLLLVIFAVLSVTVLFPVKTITVSGESPYPADQIIAASGIEVGDNVILSGRSDSAARITQQLPYIKQVSFSRNLNGRIRISVKQTNEVYSFYTNNRYAVTDSDRKVLRIASSQPADLITVRTYKGIDDTVGMTAEFRDKGDRLRFNALIEQIEKNGLDVTGIDISKSYQITLKISSRFVVLLGSNNNLEEKIAHFVCMAQKIHAEKSGIIDLSAWTTSNEESYFREKDISSYFTNMTVISDLADSAEPKSSVSSGLAD